MSDANIFQLLGLAYFGVGLGAVISPQYYLKVLKSYAESPAVVYLNGFVILAIGYLLVAYHNIWVFDWPLLITVVGWIALFKGLFMLVQPKLYVDLSKKLKQSVGFFRTQAILIAMLGILFLCLGLFIV